MAQPTHRLKVTQMVRDDRETVYEAFSDPELARQWAPDGCQVLSFAADMRVGGTFRERMSCSGKVYTAHGVYKKIVPGKTVIFTHQWEEDDPVETLVTLEFKDKKGGTEIVLTQTGFREAAEAKGHTEGWSSALASFATLLEAGGKSRPQKIAR
jgi:uncharacterized protein YndB with AHSA1/START domain